MMKIHDENLINKLKDVFEGEPRISIRRAVLRVKDDNVDVSISTSQRILKENKIKPYKITKKHRLLEPDYRKRFEFSNFILNKIYEDEHFTDYLIFTDEAWFSSTCDINSQNCRYWSPINPDQYIEMPLHDQKIMVFAAITSGHVIGPIFFESSVNQHTYHDMIINEFIPKLKSAYENQIDHLIFQQDSAPPHVTNKVLSKLKEIFKDNLITKNGWLNGMAEWPPRSPELAPCDFFLWKFLKSKLYGKKFCTIQELKNELIKQFEELSQNKLLLRRVLENFVKRCYLCIGTEGRHFKI